MAEKPRRGSRSSGQGRPGTRPGNALSGSQHRDHHVLRWRLSLGAYGGRGPEDGLPEGLFAHRWLQGTGRGGLADAERPLTERLQPGATEACVSMAAFVVAVRRRKQTRFSALTSDTTFSSVPSPIRQI